MRIEKSNGVRASRNGHSEGEYVPVPLSAQPNAAPSPVRAADAAVIVRRISAKSFVGVYIFTLFLYILLFVATQIITNTAPVWLWTAGLAAFFGVWAYAQVTLRSTLYRLHHDRLEIESGIVSRRIENIDLFRVRDVGLKQSLGGRMLNFGDLYIHSTDSSTPDLHVRGIDNPRGYYEELRDRVGSSRASGQTMIIEQGGTMREN